MPTHELLSASPYMTLATADTDGTPWASPVWFATEDGERFYWVSDPQARHSRNIAARPEIAFVVYDSTVSPGNARALYYAARAERVDASEIDVFSRCSEAQGLEAWTVAKVTAPAKHRLYRATVRERYTLDERDERLPF